MKRYSLPFAHAITHAHDQPERTAKRSLGFDVAFQVWPSRAAMARTIRMQQKRAPHPTDWSAIVPLTDGEGY